MAKKNSVARESFILKMKVKVGEVEYQKGDSISLTEKQKTYFIQQNFI